MGNTAVFSPSELAGMVEAIPSKSDAHRILICAALASTPTEIILHSTSQDIEATIACLTALGAKIQKKGRAFHVIPINFESLPQQVALNCQESGATLRFLLPVATALCEEVTVTGAGRLPNRPMEPLVNTLKQNGVTFLQEHFPLRTTGKLRSGIFSLPGDVSSQYISGLLFALPLLREDSTILITTKKESVGYLTMTNVTLKKYGIVITETKTGYLVKGRQTYQTQGRDTVEGDWSSAAFFLCAGAIGKSSVTVKGLSQTSYQADFQIMSILNQLGAKVQADEGGVTVAPSPLQAIQLDVSDIPDLVPILAVVASQAEGKTHFYNAKRLRHKESDRLQAVFEMLTKLGVQVEQTENALTVTGKTNFTRATVQNYADHRIAMSIAVAATIAKGKITMPHPQVVHKSYPLFYKDYQQLGGLVDGV